MIGLGRLCQCDNRCQNPSLFSLGHRSRFRHSTDQGLGGLSKCGGTTRNGFLIQIDAFQGKVPDGVTEAKMTQASSLATAPTNIVS
jgi:hypothetical protein